MRPGPARLRRGAWLVPIACLALGGCQAVSGIAGAIAGAGTGAASANPAVGLAVGIAVEAGVDEVVGYVSRKRQQGEQDAIADAAGAVPVGSVVPWQIRHTIPIGNENGDLLVAREFATPLVTCREIVFSVVDGKQRRLFTTTLCHQAERWKWAAAEPAVDRWGFLQ